MDAMFPLVQWCTISQTPMWGRERGPRLLAHVPRKNTAICNLAELYRLVMALQVGCCAGFPPQAPTTQGRTALGCIPLVTSTR